MDGETKAEEVPWPTPRTGAEELAAGAGPMTKSGQWGGRAAEVAGESEVVGSGYPWRKPPRSLGLELGEPLLDRPIGLPQLVVPGEPALAKRFVEGATFFDFFFQFAELAGEVLLALVKVSKQAFDGRARRRVHASFQGEAGHCVERPAARASRWGIGTLKSRG